MIGRLGVEKFLPDPSSRPSIAVLPLRPARPTMSDHDDVEEFETADAGASTTVPMQAGSVRKGGFMVIKGRPTKVRPSRDAAVFFSSFARR